ncbi:hypothetical protein RB2083_1333 [Rhodobacteraceae bacterium HTCC2083]|nr:hypothetical protein RB2083_1333 [Rhodobacteraceae bacterium HTCC2083]
MFHHRTAGHPIFDRTEIDKRGALWHHLATLLSWLFPLLTPSKWH